jgi:tRNA G46 methylase TrmB
MSFTAAKPVTSKQKGVHDRLERIVRNHLHSVYQKPIAPHNQSAFDLLYHQWQENGSPKLILDSGCGTGESSRYLAEAYPQHLVIGIDQSIKRLQNSKNISLAQNCLLIHTECSDFWRLAKLARWHFDKHYLLYPNPYPKTKHIQRRWHGHPVFGDLLAISQKMTLRTNWKIYAQEFQYGVRLAKSEGVAIEQSILQSISPQKSITAFERKYLLSGHTLWQVTSF